MSAKPGPEAPNSNPDRAAEASNSEMPPEGNQPQPASDSGAGPAGGSTETAAADARISELEGQVADLTDRLLRTHAEMDNIRKRAEREKGDTAKYAITKFAGDVAGLTDNFQRAVSAVPAGAADQDPALKALIEGVEMVEREFLNVLERHGVKRVEAKGQPFNPHLHDAVMEQQNADVPNGTVVQVFQQGFTIEDRVLRPAMVVVSKGGPKAQPAAAASAAPAETPSQAERPSEPPASAAPEEGKGDAGSQDDGQSQS